MAEIDISEGFVEDMTRVYLDLKREEIWESISLLECAPGMGSLILPALVRRRFGDRVRKLVVDPFDVIYLYYPERDLVYVAGLVHQREAR